ncbi:transcriptional regulator opi1 [Pseudogymnoascus australis]
MHLSEAPAAPEISSAGNDRGNAHGSMSQDLLTRPAEPPVEPPIETSEETPPVDETSQPMATTTTTTTAWPSSNPFVSYYRPPNGSPRSAPGVDSPGAMDLDDSRGVRGGSVLSIDDPDVRLAAEALGDLRADFVQSPPSSSRYRHRRNISGQPEPLLSLLTTSHPLVGTAIDGSISAYSASKNYSPRFKSTAEYVERRFTPVVNKVGTVGRATGVEGSVRWFLGGRRRAHNRHSAAKSTDDQSSKRRKTSQDTDRTWPMRNSTQSLGDEQQLQHRERRNSVANSLASSYVESLPAYDEYKSPSYEASQRSSLVRSEENESPGSMSSWQSRLIMSTSGLSIAMSVESLRSLKYCLGLLRWANEHIGKSVTTLKETLEDNNSKTATPTAGSSSSTEGQNVEDIFVLDSTKDREVLTKRIAELKADVLKTLKDVVDIVSKYAGGALPENARVLVRSHLTSLPQRFKMASTSTPPETDDETARADWETREGAKRVMVLAKEGLDMMTQVSGVLDGTIVSAEEWCERLGKKTYKEETAEEILKEGLVKPPIEGAATPEVFADGDYRMGQAL